MPEIPADINSELDSRYRATAMVVGVQIFFVLLLTAVGLTGVMLLPEAPDAQSLNSIWAGILFLAVGSFLLRRMLGAWESLKGVALTKGIRGLLTRLRMNALITCSIATLIGVAGFAVSAMSSDPFDMVRAAAVSILVFFANFPRKKFWRAAVSRLQA